MAHQTRALKTCCNSSSLARKRQQVTPSSYHGFPLGRDVYMWRGGCFTRGYFLELLAMPPISLPPLAPPEPTTQRAKPPRSTDRGWSISSSPYVLPALRTSPVVPGEGGAAARPAPLPTAAPSWDMHPAQGHSLRCWRNASPAVDLPILLASPQPGLLLGKL